MKGRIQEAFNARIDLSDKIVAIDQFQRNRSGE